MVIKCHHIAVLLPQFVRGIPERFMSRYRTKIGHDYQPVFKTPLLTGQKARRRLPVLPNGAHSRGGQGCPMVLLTRSVCLVLSAEKKNCCSTLQKQPWYEKTAKFIFRYFYPQQKCVHQQQVSLINPNWFVLLQN